MAGARVTSDEELHGGQGGFLIKHVGWMGEKRRQEIQDRPRHVLERTKAWMGGIGWRFRRPEGSVGRACRWRWLFVEGHAFVTLLATRMHHKIGSSPRLRGLSPVD
jgi:hypothetical protein